MGAVVFGQACGNDHNLLSTLEVLVTGSGEVTGCENRASTRFRSTTCRVDSTGVDQAVCLTANPAIDFGTWDCRLGAVCDGADQSCNAANQCSVLVRRPDSIATRDEFRCWGKFCPTAELTIDVQGAGNVTSSPSGLDCGADSVCDAPFCSDSQDVVTLTATPRDGSGAIFTGFSGDADCNDGVVTMGVGTNCIANFRQPLLDLTVTGHGRVAAEAIDCRAGSPAQDCQRPVAANATFTLTAIPDPGAVFQGWSGDCATTVTPLNIVPTIDSSCSAAFSTLAAGSGGIGVIEDVSLADDGSFGNGTSGGYGAGTGAPNEVMGVAPNADASVIAFLSDSTNLTVEAAAGVHARHRAAPTTTERVGSTDGTKIDIDAAGRFIAYQDQWLIYLFDLDMRTTELVSAAEGSISAYGDTPTISANGRYVAYRGIATGGDQTAIIVYDSCFGANPAQACTPHRVIVSVDDLGVRLRNVFNALISADGRFVAYVGNVATPPFFLLGIVIHDRDTDVDDLYDEPGDVATLHVTPDPTGGLLDAGVQAFALDASGRYVAFSSIDPDMPDQFGLINPGTFLRDTCGGAPVGCVPGYTRLSVRHDGSPGEGDIADLGPAARYVAFLSMDPLLVGSDPNLFFGTVGVVRDTCLGAAGGCVPVNHEVTVTTAGMRGDPPFHGPIRLNEDGTLGVFRGQRDIFDPGPPSGLEDIFLTLTGFLQDGGAVPTIASISPDQASAGSSGFFVTIRGSGFVPGALVTIGGLPRNTTFVSREKLQVLLKDADLLSAGVSLQLKILNPGGDISDPVSFVVN
jgi:hypothetical protein